LTQTDIPQPHVKPPGEIEGSARVSRADAGVCRDLVVRVRFCRLAAAAGMAVTFQGMKCMKQSAFYKRRLITALTTASAYRSKRGYSHGL
jgi:hypothetical protein